MQFTWFECEAPIREWCIHGLFLLKKLKIMNTLSAHVLDASELVLTGWLTFTTVLFEILKVLAVQKFVNRHKSFTTILIIIPVRTLIKIYWVNVARWRYPTSASKPGLLRVPSFRYMPSRIRSKLPTAIAKTGLLGGRAECNLDAICAESWAHSWLINQSTIR